MTVDVEGPSSVDAVYFRSPIDLAPGDDCDALGTRDGGASDADAAVEVAPSDAPWGADREPDAPVTVGDDGPSLTAVADSCPPDEASAGGAIDGTPGPCCDALEDAVEQGSSVCGSITVTALIDGRDRLHVLADGLYWEHLAYAGPGLHANQNLPTLIVTDAGGESRWCPVWDNGCNTCDGSCGELWGTGTSEPFPMTVFPANLVSTELTCTGRGYCTLLQSPTPLQPEAIIDIDDIGPDGPGTYAATLTFGCGPRG